MATDVEALRARVLDAAEALFYARGVQSVGMDEVRTASGVSLKRLYQLFPGKGELVEAYLRRRDARWLAALAAHVAAEPDPGQRPLAVFDWLQLWFAEPDFHGCAFINAFGELGATSPAVARAVADHKAAFRAYLAELVRDTPLAEQLALLAEGAMTTAAITASPTPAHHAKSAARVLLAASA
ncbi:TetR/AcrR family transcriptional regulator [Streptacidiphilus sp. N1-12]|uniref:TetR/AcrR family transcriptional regulator n=2 Tax=Streptacidiphilus alkalitolerans TaxID=3342712 RepID=A0ABV6WKM3_9ACTN